MVLKRRMVLRLGILLCPLLLRLVSWELVFFEYVRDRITRTENIESLAQIIRNKTVLICLVGRGRITAPPLIIEPKNCYAVAVSVCFFHTAHIFLHLRLIFYPIVAVE